MMGCLKNLPHYVLRLAKIAAQRLMFTIGFRFDVSRAKRCFATLERKNTTLSANRAKARLELEAIGQSNALYVLLPRFVKIAVQNLKRLALKTLVFVQKNAAIKTKLSCTLAATTWLRLKEMATSAASAAQNSHPMFITLIFQGVLKRPTRKGATTI
jgi:hypothetical protein